MDYQVYALYSESLDSIYIGQSQNLDKRLQDHNNGYSKFTSKSNDWIIIYSETCESRSFAMKREKQLKSAGGRRFIWEIVKNKY